MNRRTLTMIFDVCLLIGSFNAVQCQFNMYETEQNVTVSHPHRDCLPYYAPNNIHLVSGTQYNPKSQVISYCLRPLDIFNDTLLSEDHILLSDGHKAVTFRDLSQQGVNSQQMLAWSAPIDLIERYQIYLNNPIVSLSQQIFYKCSLPWFGARCEYKFVENNHYSFDKVVESTFLSLKPIDDLTGFRLLTCYVHLTCVRGPYPMCLDWREVCDGKVDCLDGGQDEENCFELEINECNENEYRCDNGMQCIPLQFLNDDEDNPDCTDQTDEPSWKVSGHINTILCRLDTSFRCEEHSCRAILSENFVCGDGECSDENGKCSSGRGNLAVYAMITPQSGDDESFCRAIMRCITWRNCPTICSTVKECTIVVRTYCKKSLFTFPDFPILFGHVIFIFSNDRSLERISVPLKTDVYSIRLLPEYLCYNEHLCSNILPVTTILFGNLTCRHFHSEFNWTDSSSWSNLIVSIKEVFHRCSTIHDLTNQTHCRHYSQYQCTNSPKCISKHRFNDGINDCYESDDEISTVHRNKSNSSINNDGTIGQIDYSRLCDGYRDMKIDDIRNETDETDCNWWPCNNIYTQCDRIWNCHNGRDEVNCAYLPMCPLLFHPCVSPENFSLTCLPIDRAGDGVVDCIGASDERYLCRRNDLHYFGNTFRCWNDSSCLSIDMDYLCDDKTDCPFNDDERVCDRKYILSCAFAKIDKASEVIAFLCQPPFSKADQTILSLQNLIEYPEQSAIQYNVNTSVRIEPNIDIGRRQVTTSNSRTKRQQTDEWSCNRGIHVMIRRGRNTFSKRCLCPPAYYGNLCQYQSQRVSLTLQVRAEADWRNSFTLIISLVDQYDNIESFDQIQYLAVRDCTTKFDTNLLYPNRPKNISNNYSVRIDAYNRHTLIYRASWIFPITFSFLPVYRIAAQLTIPIKTLEDCTLKCDHGQCIHFLNKNDYACRCDPGWAGYQCSISLQCHCAPDSLCVAGGWPSICICPLKKFGPRCYLTRYTCQPDTCEYHGECIEVDERVSINNFTCICHEGFSGERCQYVDTRITITFDQLSVPPSILGHFIWVRDNGSHIRTTTFQKIPPDQDSTSLYTSDRFHLLFVQFAHNHYISVAQEKSIMSAVIKTKITPSRRCPHISELFNSTVLAFSQLRRAKLYHFLCDRQSELRCFYDETLMCVCNTNRFANCFRFDHNMTYNCQGSYFCKNGARCFQDKPTCPTKSMCICADCFYGTHCQFSTTGFAISLQAILAYQIRPRIHFTRQTIGIQISASVVIILFVLGLFNSIFSICTFQTSASRKVGCGLYLLSTSVISLLTMFIFLMQFFLLVHTQISSNTSRSFLSFNCRIIDFLLRVLLGSGDWLNTGVAAERVWTVCKGVTFDQKKSKYIAKRMIILVIFLITLSTIHDPIHRQLIDDIEEERTWCVTSYSSTVKLYDSVVLFLHFLIPLLINGISAFVIITTVARQRSAVRVKQTYQQHLREQFLKTKYLLIPPCVLVLLALPRLVLSFLSGCMQSARNPWRFLIGYFLSFLPSTLTFVVYVLPSKTYKEQFHDWIRRFQLLIFPHSCRE